VERVARRHGLDLAIEEGLRCVEVVRGDRLDELPRAVEAHGTKMYNRPHPARESLVKSLPSS
jgi:hypothetical protein